MENPEMIEEARKFREVQLDRFILLAIILRVSFMNRKTLFVPYIKVWHSWDMYVLASERFCLTWTTVNITPTAIAITITVATIAVTAIIVVSSTSASISVSQRRRTVEAENATIVVIPSYIRMSYFTSYIFRVLLPLLFWICLRICSCLELAFRCDYSWNQNLFRRTNLNDFEKNK